MSRAILLAWFVVACGGASVPASTEPPATSAYPPGWIEGICEARAQIVVDGDALGAANADESQARITAGLVALDKLADWTPGERARDELESFFVAMQSFLELEEASPGAGTDALLDAVEQLGDVDQALGDVEAATGQAIPCRQEASPGPS